MSVYHEAVKSGRIRHEDIVRIGARRALREAKRHEAEERNAHTPTRRTKAYRREIGLLPPLKKETRRG